jgi:hypothetical protein
MGGFESLAKENVTIYGNMVHAIFHICAAAQLTTTASSSRFVNTCGSIPLLFSLNRRSKKYGRQTGKTFD